MAPRRPEANSFRPSSAFSARILEILLSTVAIIIIVVVVVEWNHFQWRLDVDCFN